MRKALFLLAAVGAFAFNQQIKNFFVAKPDPQDQSATATAPAAPAAAAVSAPPRGTLNTPTGVASSAFGGGYVSPLDEPPASGAPNAPPSAASEIAAAQQAQATALQNAKRRIISGISSTGQ